ncbi:hypothetical protein GPJ57_10665 [Burkholderia pseudomallei]|nr:hypothetical protein [Burkholderia pseudomallei]
MSRICISRRRARRPARHSVARERREKRQALRVVLPRRRRGAAAALLVVARDVGADRAGAHRHVARAGRMRRRTRFGADRPVRALRRVAAVRRRRAQPPALTVAVHADPRLAAVRRRLQIAGRAAPAARHGGHAAAAAAETGPAAVRRLPEDEPRRERARHARRPLPDLPYCPFRHHDGSAACFSARART